MAARTPELRKGLTREELLAGTWYAKLLNGTYSYKPDPLENEAAAAFVALVDHLIAYVNAGNRVTRKDVTTFFTMVERCAGVRAVITERMGKGELTPSLLDELVK